MVLEYFLSKSGGGDKVEVEFFALEAFGHHVNRIEIYDLFAKENQTKSWSEKTGKTIVDHDNVVRVKPKDAAEGRKLIESAHRASHFAPTGKNPESSRGHISFIIKVKQEPAEHSIQT